MFVFKFLVKIAISVRSFRNGSIAYVINKKPFSKLLVLSVVLVYTACDTQKNNINILDFGAIPDGKTLNTEAIQKAINKAIAAKDTLVIPSGKFYTGSLVLGPDMTLYLEKGAELIASKDMRDYKTKEFITAPYAHHLKIVGEGVINGNGESFFDENWKFTARPEPWIDISDAKNVRVSGLTFINSPSHTLNFSYCDSVTVKDIKIINNPRSPNTDGIDIRNTKNVWIENCGIRTGDDAICIKNTRKEKYLINSKGEKRNNITENITAQNCYIESDDSALKLGTGSGYLTRNILFDNIKIRNSRYAIALFMMDGGNYENITFQNINAITGGRHRQQYGIFIDVHQRNQDSKPGVINDIKIINSNIQTQGIHYISGHPQKEIGRVLIKDTDFVIFDPLDNKTWKKPKGNKNIKYWSTTSDYATEQASFILAQTNDMIFQNVNISIPNDIERSIFWQKNVQIDTTNFQVSTFKN